ncbi:MAG: 4Fe-4S binding protein [Firmicutes bacterium]|nr:4Fe-4S binding protein [Bacillota bacterium]
MVNRNIILRFSPEMVDQPLVYRLVKDFDLIPNIIKANVNQDRKGNMVLSISGYENDYKEAVEYMKSCGMEVSFLADTILWDKDSCTQCGACTAVCPSQALYIERPDMTVHFDSDKCIVCQMCLQACPVKAVKLDI